MAEAEQEASKQVPAKRSAIMGKSRAGRAGDAQPCIYQEIGRSAPGEALAALLAGLAGGAWLVQGLGDRAYAGCRVAGGEVARAVTGDFAVGCQVRADQGRATG